LIQKPAHTGGTLKGIAMKKPLLILALIAHGGITAGALWTEGLAGLIAAITHSYGSMQIFSDLVIALILVMIWMWRDAKNSGRNVWPWIAITLVAGSFGPLLYFIAAKEKE
jgi:Terpene cyclase DEP1